MPSGEPGQTQSLCPVCLRALPARRVERGRDVFLERTCPEHGPFSVRVWHGEPALSTWRRPKIPTPPNPGGASGLGCPRDCGLCPEHGQHTCTALLEVTARCNLSCHVCFARSGEAPPPDPGLEVLRARLELLRQQAGACNLQISGGEPTVRGDLPLIVEAARRAGFPFVQLNTNGIELAREPGLASTLAASGLDSVFLQFDGSDAACLALRGKPLLDVKLEAIRACGRAGLGVVLMPTLARGVNTDQVGDILRLGIALAPVVRGVHFQPVAAFGRHPWDAGGAGPTLPEVLRALEEQGGGLVRASDVHPPGCEHAMCSFSGTFLLNDRGGLDPMPQAGGGCDCAPAPASEGAAKSRAFTARQWAAAPPAPEPASPGLADDFDRFLARAGAHRRFSISCMAFQDAWSVDLERLRGCCIHVAAPDGRLVPFCAYNLTASDGTPLYRGRGAP